MNKLYLYMIDSHYLKYLHGVDNRVPDENKPSRKFIGVVLFVNGIRYYAPLSSPKEKHKNMNRKALDIFKIDEGKLGVINLNNMVPVPESALIKFNINEEKVDYQNLLKKQIITIRTQSSKIIEKAEKLYKICKTGKQSRLNHRCCNFILLEKYYEQFDIPEVAATKKVD